MLQWWKVPKINNKEMENSNPKSQIIDAIRKSTNILVTVSHNPSVDALAAALGFSLMINKMDKHATSVFSGAIPPAISFLEPEKTFTGTVSSLRDFIIALDKEKADRLRYKVEGDVVRIYITPYKTTITQDDLEFSEGDFNVDLVIALGVDKQSDLDSAISAHGRILHDSVVATINLESQKSSLGTMNWCDDKASSLCEMLMSLSEALQSNILDQQIASALLTGIVAATDRFSNSHTSPRVMTMSAQLMAAGANQQLIAEALSMSPDAERQDFRVDRQSEADAAREEALKIERSAAEQASRDEAKEPSDDEPEPKPTEDVAPEPTPSDKSQPPESKPSPEDELSAQLENTQQNTEPKDSLSVLHDDIKAETPTPLNEDWRDGAGNDEPPQDTKPEQTDANEQPPHETPAIQTHKGGPVGYVAPNEHPGSQTVHGINIPTEPPPVDIFDYEMTNPPVVPQVAPPEPSQQPQDQPQQAPTPAEPPQPEQPSPLDVINTQAQDIESSRQAVEQALNQAQPAPMPEPPQPAAPPIAPAPQIVPGPPPLTQTPPPVAPSVDFPFIPPPPPPPMPDFSQFPQVPTAPPAGQPQSSNVPPAHRGSDNTHQISSSHVNLNVPPQDRARKTFGNPNSPYTPPPSVSPAPTAPGQFRIPGQ